MDEKKNLDGVGGWGELYPIFFLDFWNLLNFAKPLNEIPFLAPIPCLAYCELMSIGKQRLTENGDFT